MCVRRSTSPLAALWRSVRWSAPCSRVQHCCDVAFPVTDCRARWCSCRCSRGSSGWCSGAVLRSLAGVGLESLVRMDGDRAAAVLTIGAAEGDEACDLEGAAAAAREGQRAATVPDSATATPIWSLSASNLSEGFRRDHPGRTIGQIHNSQLVAPPTKRRRHHPPTRQRMQRSVDRHRSRQNRTRMLQPIAITVDMGKILLGIATATVACAASTLASSWWATPGPPRRSK